MKNTRMTMKKVFDNLPRGYWRNINGVTIAIKDMEDDYIRNVVKFLNEKMELTDFLKAHQSSDIWYNGKRIPTKYAKSLKNPTRLQYIIKILELELELKNRREHKCA